MAIMITPAMANHHIGECSLNCSILPTSMEHKEKVNQIALIHEQAIIQKELEAKHLD